jgi:hypothetical protein
VFANHGKGGMAYLPWDVGGLYYRHSSPAHAALIADVVDRLLPGGRLVRTDAHPLVEVTVMQQPSRRRTLLHLVNGTGHSGTAYFAPLELRDITIEIAAPVARARAVDLNQTLAVKSSGRYRSITLPRLREYEVIVLE